MERNWLFFTIPWQNRLVNLTRYLSGYQMSIYIFIHSPTIYSSTHAPIHPSIHAPIHPFIHALPIHPFIYWCNHLFIHLFMHPFIHSSIHLSIYPCINSCTHSFISSFIFIVYSWFISFKDLQDQLRPLQFVLKSLQESYNDTDRSTDNTDSVPPKKWASSSDLISDQTKENITLTPVNQMKPTNEQEGHLTTSRPGSANENKVSPRRTPRMLPTPQHLIVSPEEIIVSSPYDLEKRRYSSPNTRSSYEDDLSSTASSVQLRRHSYLNAIGTDEEEEEEPNRRYTESSAAIEKKIRKAKLGYPSQIKLANGTHSNGHDTLPTGDMKTKRDLSKSFAETNGKNKKKSPRERPWSLVLDYQSSSPKETRSTTPPVIMDRSRTLPVAGSPKTQRKAPSLAIIDSITRSQTERDSDQSSPSSSPLPQRRTPQHSPRLLRARIEQTPEQTPAMKAVVRTPSATSSSSSESSGSWRSASFGSGGTADRIRRRHILPCTPNMDGSRRDSRWVDKTWHDTSNARFSWWPMIFERGRPACTYHQKKRNLELTNTLKKPTDSLIRWFSSGCSLLTAEKVSAWVDMLKRCTLSFGFNVSFGTGPQQDLKRMTKTTAYFLKMQWFTRYVQHAVTAMVEATCLEHPTISPGRGFRLLSPQGLSASPGFCEYWYEKTAIQVPELIVILFYRNKINPIYKKN